MSGAVAFEIIEYSKRVNDNYWKHMSMVRHADLKDLVFINDKLK